MESTKNPVNTNNINHRSNMLSVIFASWREIFF